MCGRAPWTGNRGTRIDAVCIERFSRRGGYDVSTPTIRQHSRTLRLGLALALGLTLIIICLLSIGAFRSPDLALAQDPTIRYVAPAPTGDDSGNDCTDSNAPCATVQHAVDEPGTGDVICVATGTYTDLHVRPRNDITTTGVVTQVVYIDKTVTIRGGYTNAFTDPPNPEANPTTLDAQGQGRVLYITGDISPTIEGLRVTGGEAYGLGGGVTGEHPGGGVYIITATAIFSNNQVFNNTIYDHLDHRHGNGGGLYVLNSNGVLLSNNMISSNVSGQGGGMYFENSSGAMLMANTISENRATDGGGLFFRDSSNAVLTTNTISGNGATNGGGLLFIKSPDATLASNTIIDNEAQGPYDNYDDGGGLYCGWSENMTLTNNVIRENWGHDYGGGLRFLACYNIKLVANMIAGNYSRYGGGLSLEDGAYIELSNNMIGSNWAFQGGGANFVEADSVTLIGNTVISNNTWSASGIGGGGLHFEDSTSVNLINNRITHNGPYVTFGGGLYLDSSDITMTNNVIADNQVEVEGSGLYITDSSPRLLHTTIARNSGGDGSGVHITGTLSTVAMTNTILTSQTVGVYVANGNTASLNGVLWHDNGTNYDGPGTIVVSNEHSGDPAFADDGYHLTFASAAIDNGMDAGVKTDIDGDPRPCRLGPDLGADEISCRYLPIILKNR